MENPTVSAMSPRMLAIPVRDAERILTRLGSLGPGGNPNAARRGR
jgi:hypothetical protein